MPEIGKDVIGEGGRIRKQRGDGSARAADLLIDEGTLLCRLTQRGAGTQL